LYLSKLEGKEIINLYDGSRLGVLGNAELLFDPDTGYIKGLVFPGSHRFFSFGQNKEEITIPWSSIHKVGADMMLVDLRPQKGQSRGQQI